MTEQAQAVVKLLKDREIKFDIVEHNAVYTIDEMLELNLPNQDAIAKNLFIRDDKKKNYYLLVIREDKRVNLKSLRDKLGSRPLTFASENDLSKILGLTKGAVTPFGILNDEERKVKVIFDESFCETLIGVHPNDNTATVWLDSSDLIYIIEQHGNSIEFMEM
ncbi:MAG: prolyl-tRNA synthetase associated domain-containing protein [Intestinibacter sp.]|uniref:prolyl-tRNA synthetase associated domain-containing protein n=1 Tax=Intestinibacter sp. TaxID=1965304 RepID=UPI003F15F5F8